MKQSPSHSALTLLVMLSVLFLMLCPSVSAMYPRDGARHVDRTNAARHIRVGIRMEDGMVTDDDGIIGNGTRGADRAPSSHRRHHARPTSGNTAEADVVTLGGGMLPERDGAQPRDGALDRAIGDLSGGMLGDPSTPMRGRTLPDEGTNDNDVAGNGGIANDDIADGNTENGNGGDMVEDGTIEDGHAEDGVVDDSGEGKGETEDGNSSARSILPWIIGILVVLAAVLVALALMPRRRRR